MNPDGDPQLREWIEGLRREPSGIPDQTDPIDFNKPSPGSRPPSVASSYGSIDSGVSHPPRVGNKRKKRVDITWSDFDGFGEDGEKPKAPKLARKGEPDAKGFACPFYKRYPQEFKESRTCAGTRWEDFHKVREHILHKRKYSGRQCHRCYGEFATEAALYDHQRADNPCEKKPVSNNIDVQQEKRLRRAGMYRGHFANEKNWNVLYKIIFPDVKVIPSPYYELPDFPGCYRDLLMNRLPSLVRKEMSNSMGQERLHPKILQRVETAVTTALKKCFHEAYEKENSKQTENQIAPVSQP